MKKYPNNGKSVGGVENNDIGKTLLGLLTGLEDNIRLGQDIQNTSKELIGILIGSGSNEDIKNKLQSLSTQVEQLGVNITLEDFAKLYNNGIFKLLPNLKNISFTEENYSIPDNIADILIDVAKEKELTFFFPSVKKIYCMSQKQKELFSEYCQFTSPEELKREGANRIEQLIKKIKHIEMKSITLFGCYNSQKLPKNISELNVKNFSLQDIYNIKKLPTKIWEIKNLETIELEGCTNLESIPTVKNETSIKKISLGDINKIDKIPESILLMPNLKTLALSGCHNLQGIPKEINQSHIKELSLSDTTKIKQLGKNIWRMPNLKVIRISGNNDEIELSSDIENCQTLEQLQLNSLGIKKLPDNIGELPHLKILHVQNCEKLKEMPQTLQGSNVEEVFRFSTRDDESNPTFNSPFFDNGIIERKKDSSEAKKWKNFGDYVLLKDISKMKKLKKLTIGNFNGNIMPSLTLEYDLLEIMSCFELESLSKENIENRKVTRLHFIHNKKLQELPKELWKIKELNELEISGSQKLDILPEGIEESNIQVLKIGGITGGIGIQSLPKNIWKMKKLKTLHIQNCEKLKERPEGIENSPLEELILKYNDTLKKLPQGIEKSNIKKITLPKLLIEKSPVGEELLKMKKEGKIEINIIGQKIG